MKNRLSGARHILWFIHTRNELVVSFLKVLEKKYSQSEAAVFKARSLKKVKEVPRAEPTKFSSQFTALQTVLSSKMVSDLLKKIKRNGKLSDKDLRGLALVSPKILGSLLLDMRVLTKAKQPAFVRQLSDTMLKK